MNLLDYTGTGEFAKVDDIEAAIEIFEDYEIPYHVVTKGENMGKVRVKKKRDDDEWTCDLFCDMLEDNGCGDFIDEILVFRDLSDELIFCLCPSHAPFEKVVRDGREGYIIPPFPGYTCDVRSKLIREGGAATFVFSRD